MRIAVLSDIHANLEALEATIDDMAAGAVDRVACLGDAVGYGADPAECLARLRGLDPVCVAGNHDRAVCGAITTEGFSLTAARAVRWTRRRLGAADLAWLAALPLKAAIGDRLVLVHGALHPENGCELVRLEDDDGRRRSLEALRAHPSGARVCAFGHTHRPGAYELDGEFVREKPGDEIVLRPGALHLLNPGSVGQSRSADPRATYLLLDLERGTASLRRVAYDAAAAAAKRRRAGLEPPLAFLPAGLRGRVKRGARLLGLHGLARRALR